MGLVVYWYDLVCFSMVAASSIGALYVIWRREGAGKSGDRTLYESLVVVTNRSDHHGGYGTVRGVTPEGHVSSTQLWTSCWLGLHPVWLLGLRSASFVILSVFLILSGYLHYESSIFVYYTQWTFALVILYFAIGTAVSAQGCLVYYSTKPSYDNGRREEFLRSGPEASSAISTSGVNFWAKQPRTTIKLQSHYDQEAIQQRAGYWGYLMQIAYQTSAGAVILTDLVFWCFIVPFLSNAESELNMLMGCMHTLNAVFLLLDTAVNSLTFPWFRLSYFVLWSCCYVIFQWLIHACGYSPWPYPFLELSSPWATFWYLCLAAVHIPCYGLYSLLVTAKHSIFPTLFPQAFVQPAF